MAISEILEEVKNDICRDYCKYVAEYQAVENEADEEMFFECHCNDCPLNRL